MHIHTFNGSADAVPTADCDLHNMSSAASVNDRGFLVPWLMYCQQDADGAHFGMHYLQFVGESVLASARLLHCQQLRLSAQFGLSEWLAHCQQLADGANFDLSEL